MSTPTIVDIAKAAGVSIKTVSRVINREPRVRDDTREKVEAVIARLNYKPNVWARTLRSARTRLVALICEEVSQTYVNQMLVSAMTVCQEAGYHLLIERVRPDQRNLKQRVQGILQTVRLDGVLLAPPMSDSAMLLEALKAEKLPFVRVSPYHEVDGGSSVHIDNHAAAYEMTRFLLGLGHRDIGFVTGPADHGAAALRLEGFEGAMRDHGGNLHREWVQPGQFSVRSGMAAGEKLLALDRRPTAIFAANDEMAMGVMSAAYRARLVLPRDLSIAGFDDSPIASAVWPGLTTVHQPVAKLAKVATEMLLNHIEAGGPGRVRKLDFRIVERESTAPLQAPA